MKKTLSYAFKKSIPVMAGYIFLGIAFGILLYEAGFNWIWAFMMSLFIYAGSMEFTMVPLMAAGASPILMAVTTLFVNSRHIFYGLSFTESFKKLKSRPYMIFSLTDETYSVLCSCKNEDPGEKEIGSWFYIALINHFYWVLGSTVGGLLGQALPFDFTGIDFSMTALFLVILLEQVLTNKKKTGVVAVTGLFVGIISLLIFGTDKFLLPALIVTVGITACYVNLRKPSFDKEVQND